jgi:Reverse transcriptase (RNA-dependent DNA polymerase)
MPFGLTYAPAVFQSFISGIFSEFIDTKMLIYIDDILLFSKTREEHVEMLELIFKRLSQSKLFVNLKKSEFFVEKISFLGFEISGRNIKPQRDKILAIEKWPKPKRQKELQRFLGFINYYRRFIKNYSHIVSPLYKLTSKQNENNFIWTTSCNKAFEKIKELLIVMSIFHTHKIINSF